MSEKEILMIQLSREGKVDELRKANPERKGNVAALREAIASNQTEAIVYWLDDCMTNSSTLDLARLFKDKSVEEMATNVALPLLTFPSNPPIPGRTYVKLYMVPEYVRNHRCVDLTHCFTHNDKCFTKSMEIQFRYLPYMRNESADLRLALTASESKARTTQTIDLAKFASTVLEMNPINGTITQFVGDGIHKIDINKSTDVVRLVNGKAFSLVSKLPVLN